MNISVSSVNPIQPLKETRLPAAGNHPPAGRCPPQAAFCRPLSPNPDDLLQSRNPRSLHSRAVTEEPNEVAALFAKLKEEVRAAGPRGSDVPPAHVRLSVRDQAERLWPISAERPIVGKGGPLKWILRRLMRWYVEPAFADQRAFNDAVLKLIDDLDERIQRLERP
jgi:hypothetical protein